MEPTTPTSSIWRWARSLIPIASTYSARIPIGPICMGHTTEDSFWRTRNILPHLKDVTPAVLIVGGWYDAEDLAGTLMTYQAIRRQSPKTICKLIMGPWAHGDWNYDVGDKMGDIPFGSDTADTYYVTNELRFFREYLKARRRNRRASARVHVR